MPGLVTLGFLCLSYVFWFSCSISLYPSLLSYYPIITQTSPVSITSSRLPCSGTLGHLGTSTLCLTAALLSPSMSQSACFLSILPLPRDGKLFEGLSYDLYSHSPLSNSVCEIEQVLIKYILNE